MPEMQFGRSGPPPALMAEYMRQMAAQQQARRAAGGQLYQMFGGQAPQIAPQPQMVGPGGAAPPMPGTPQGGPMPPPPGANPAAMPMRPPMGGPPTGPASSGMPPPPMAAAGGAPGGAPPSAPAPAAPPPQIQPFRPMPAPPQQMGASGGIAPPPAADSPAGPGMSDPGKQFNLQALIKQLQGSGVPPDKVMDMLDQLGPVMNAQNKQELEFFKAHNTALKQANETYTRLMTAMAAQTRSATGEKAEERKTEQGNRRLDIMTKRAEQLAGGSGNLKGKIELIYPKGPDGKVDQSKEPVGTRATTKSGKIVYLDADGLQSSAAALAGGTASEDKASRVGVTNVVRQSLVKAGVTNALARLKDIETKYPSLNTSAFFGTHGDNPATRAIYGGGRGMMSSEQKQADAAWGSFIDEAIPVFTGGLRGSDAFRRFLIEQAPGVGDDKASRTEKVRLLKANIEGTSHAFFDRFANDSSMWLPGTKPEDVEEAKAAIAKPAAPRAPAAAPKASGAWKVEKVN